MITNKLSLLQKSIGIIYLWFGFLKFFDGLSPAKNIAIETIDIITFSLIPHSISIVLLACIEVAIGVFLLFNWFTRQVVLITFAHLICTFIPLFAFKSLSFTTSPYALTLLGQYIVKNIVLMAALWVIYPSKKSIS